MRRCHVRKSPCRGAHAEAACKVIQYARRFNTQDNSRRQAPGCTRCIRESFFIYVIYVRVACAVAGAGVGAGAGGTSRTARATRTARTACTARFARTVRTVRTVRTTRATRTTRTTRATRSARSARSARTARTARTARGPFGTTLAVSRVGPDAAGPAALLCCAFMTLQLHFLKGKFWIYPKKL